MTYEDAEINVDLQSDAPWIDSANNRPTQTNVDANYKNEL